MNTNVNRRNILAAFNLPLKSSAMGPDASRRFATTISSREQIRDRHFPNLMLSTHEGKRVRFYDDLIRDKIVVLNFMFTSCNGVCPAITSNLARVQKILGPRIGRDIFMYSISLDPGHDSPKVLKEFAADHGAGPGWLFLTGRPAHIETLRRRLGFTDPDPSLDQDREQHIGNVRYGNEPLQQWAACPGLARPEFIAESILWVDWPAARVSRTRPG
jgi:protein SCO1/2